MAGKGNLSRTGFASYFIAFRYKRFRLTFLHSVNHHFSDLSSSFCGNYLSLFARLNNFFFAVCDNLCYNLGTNQNSPISNSLNSLDHLNRGDSNSLTKCGSYQINSFPIFLVPNCSVSLFLQVNSCFFPKAEFKNVFIKSVYAQFIRYKTNTDVVGMLNNFCHS